MVEVAVRIDGVDSLVEGVGVDTEFHGLPWLIDINAVVHLECIVDGVGQASVASRVTEERHTVKSAIQSLFDLVHEAHGGAEVGSVVYTPLDDQMRFRNVLHCVVMQVVNINSSRSKKMFLKRSCATQRE